MPLTTPFRLSLPSGPASRFIGSAACSGPVIGGVGSGVGAAGAAAGAAGGFDVGCWSAGIEAGTSVWLTQGEEVRAARLAPRTAVEIQEASFMLMARFLQSSAPLSCKRGSLARGYQPNEACSVSPTHSSATTNRNFCDISFL